MRIRFSFGIRFASKIETFESKFFWLFARTCSMLHACFWDVLIRPTIDYKLQQFTIITMDQFRNRNFWEILQEILKRVTWRFMTTFSLKNVSGKSLQMRVQWLWYFTCLHWTAGRDHVLTIEYSSEFLKKFSIKWEDKSSNPIWLKIDLIPPQQDFIFFLMFFWVSLKFRLWTMRAYICAIDIILPQPVGHYGDTWNVKMIESP